MPISLINKKWTPFCRIKWINFLLIKWTYLPSKSTPSIFIHIVTQASQVLTRLPLCSSWALTHITSSSLLILRSARGHVTCPWADAMFVTFKWRQGPSNFWSHYFLGPQALDPPHLKGRWSKWELQKEKYPLLTAWGPRK